MRTARVTVSSVPVRIAHENPQRSAIHIICTHTDGVLIGVDEGMTPDTAYFVPQNQRLKLAYHKGEVWAMRPSANDVQVYVLEE